MTYWTWWLFKMIGQKLHTTGAPNQPKMNKSILAKIYTVLFSHLRALHPLSVSMLKALLSLPSEINCKIL